MARPRSEDKRNAVLRAATRVIVKQGLSAPTAVIADAAGVANGTLFTYFKTKADLFNALYLELKTEMAEAALESVPTAASTRAQFFKVWTNWMNWAVASPHKRRALALLGVADEITRASHEEGHRIMSGVAVLMEKARAKGPLRNASFAFVGAIMNSLADATMDFMLQDPKNAQAHSKVGYEALWRVLA